MHVILICFLIFLEIYVSNFVIKITLDDLKTTYFQAILATEQFLQVATRSIAHVILEPIEHLEINVKATRASQHPGAFFCSVGRGWLSQRAAARDTGAGCLA
jgi:hypothetical protein